MKRLQKLVRRMRKMSVVLSSVESRSKWSSSLNEAVQKMVPPTPSSTTTSGRCPDRSVGSSTATPEYPNGPMTLRIRHYANLNLMIPSGRLNLCPLSRQHSRYPHPLVRYISRQPLCHPVRHQSVARLLDRYRRKEGRSFRIWTLSSTAIAKKAAKNLKGEFNGSCSMSSD